MPKRGANGTLDTSAGRVSLSGGRLDKLTPRQTIIARYDVMEFPHGRSLGTATLQRHVYRTAFTGKRYGYDREHSCWSGDFAEYQPGRRSLRCYRTLAEVAGLLLRESKREVPQ